MGAGLIRSNSSLVSPRDLAVTAFLRGFLAGLSAAGAGAGFTFSAAGAGDSPLFFLVLIVSCIGVGIVDCACIAKWRCHLSL